jgi:chemotaxis protein CheX
MSAPVHADYINPFLHSTVTVFSRLANLEVRRNAPFIRQNFAPQYDVTGIIGLTGKATGTVAVSFSKQIAISLTESLLGEQPPDINAQVVDAVGELTNMIAGSAKAELESLQLSLGLPTVLIGKATCVAFPSCAIPISIPFESSMGPLVVEVGISF